MECQNCYCEPSCSPCKVRELREKKWTICERTTIEREQISFMLRMIASDVYFLEHLLVLLKPWQNVYFREQNKQNQKFALRKGVFLSVYVYVSFFEWSCWAFFVQEHILLRKLWFFHLFFDFSSPVDCIELKYDIERIESNDMVIIRR